MVAFLALSLLVFCLQASVCARSVSEDAHASLQTISPRQEERHFFKQNLSFCFLCITVQVHCNYTVIHMSTQEKTTVYQIRVLPSLRTAFLAACSDNDRDGAQLVRDFMRDYVRKNAQGDLLKVK